MTDTKLVIDEQLGKRKLNFLYSKYIMDLVELYSTYMF